MMRILFKVLAAAGLSVCLAAPVLYFLGKISLRGFRSIFLISSLGYLLFAVLLSRKPRP